MVLLAVAVSPSQAEDVTVLGVVPRIDLLAGERGFARLGADDARPALVEIHLVAGEVPVPDRVAGGARDELEALSQSKQRTEHELVQARACTQLQRWERSAETTGWLRETELVPKTQGTISAIKEIGFALNLARRGKVPPPFPPHVAKKVEEARALYDLVKEEGRAGALGIVQGERALGRIEHDEEGPAER